MKRKALFISLIVLMLAIVACQPSPATQPVSSTEAPPAALTEAPPGNEPLDIAFFVPWTEDPWYVAAIDGAEERAAQLGINLTVYDAGNDADVQVQQLDQAMTKKPDAIVLSSVDPAAMITGIERAHDAGTVVVVYDRPIWDTPKIDALVVLDVPGMAKAGGQAAIDYLTNKNGSAKGTIIRVYGDPADSWVTALNTGWDPFMAQYPDVEVLSAVSGAWDPAQAAANTQQLLVSHPEVEAIVLDADFLASGIVTSLETNGYGKTGEDNHIYLVGSNGAPEALDYIRQSWMDMTINHPIADFVGAAIEIAANIVNKEPLPAQWTEDGEPWSPATIYPQPQYGSPNFPPEAKAYNGPVLLMLSVPIGPDEVDDPSLWGNVARK